jgi:hypothetical protein
MPVPITVRVDVTSLENVKRGMREDSDALRLGIAKAINDTAKHAKSFTSRLIRQHVPIPKRRLDRFIKRTFASPNELHAEVTVTDTGALPLKLFKAKQVAKGVTVKLDKQGPAKLIEHAFIVPRLGGNVFRRKGESRLPIEKLFGPSPLDVYEQSGSPQLAQKDAEAFLERRLAFRVGEALPD